MSTFRYTNFRLVALNGYGFSKPFRLVQIESADGYGFLRRVCVESKKRKYLVWCAWWFSITHKIQSDLLYNIHQMDSVKMVHHTIRTPLATRTSSTSNATTTVCGWTTIGRNPTTRGILTTSLCSVSETAFFSAISKVAVFLFWILQAFLPTTKHFPYLFKFQSHLLAMCVWNEFSFPRHRYQEFQRIEHQHTFRYLFAFLLLFGKISDVWKLKQIKKLIFNPRTDRVSSTFSNMRSNTDPNQISLFDSIQNRGGIEREREREDCAC